jgi:5-methylcytosine-specific restriction enzyme A
MPRKTAIHPPKTADTPRDILRDALGVDRGLVAPDVRRDPRWAKESREWLAEHAECELCGHDAIEDLEVHHERPYHLFPELEMDRQYWHALCRRPHDCHRLWGHLSDFSLYNPILRESIVIVKLFVRMAKAALKISRQEKGRD